MDKKMMQAMTNYSYVGIFFGVAIVICYLAGTWADKRWHTYPYLTVGGVILGVATGFRELYRVSKKALKEDEQ